MILPLLRAVIADEDRVLLTLNRRDGEVYLLPGGEQQVGESISVALARHVKEQTGYEVAAHELLWIREHIDGGALLDRPGSHVAELFYRCTLSEAAVAAPHGGRRHQVGVEWVSRHDLDELRFLPRSLVGPLAAYLTDRGVSPPVYAVEAT